MGKKKILSGLLSVCMLFSAVCPQTAVKAGETADAVTIYADANEYTSFVSEEYDEDWADAIKQMIADAKEASEEGTVPVIISFPKGTYNIYPDHAYKKELYISNTVGANQNYKDKNIGFLLEDMENITIEGNGSSFIFHGNMMTFATINSKNVTFQNYEFDFADPSVVDLTVESVEGNSATVYVPEYYNYTVSGTTVTWKSSVSPYTGQNYWTAQNALANIANQVYDASTDLTVRQSTPLFNSLSSLEDLGNRRLKFTYNNGIHAAIKEGITFQMRNTTRDHSGMFFWKSEDIKLKDIGVHFLYGFGIVGQNSTNITLDGVIFDTPEGSGRTTVGFADFVQMSGCKGKILIENCDFSNPHDDPINVHGTFMKVIEKSEDNKTFTVQYQHNETAGFPNFFEGDEVEFMTAGNMIPVEDSVATVVSVEGPTGDSGTSESGTGSLTNIRITLDRALPQIQVNTHVVENITYTPSVVIQNNIFRRTPTRGILVTTRKPVVIKDNIFDGMGMASIYISNDAQGWWESGPARDVTIEGNTFIRPSAGHAAVFIEPTNPTVSTEATVHENIKINDNIFYMQNGQVLNAKSVKGLSFTNNQIYRYEPEIDMSLNAANTLRTGKTIQLAVSGTGKTFSSNLYSFNGCKEVLLQDNLYDGGLKLNASIYNMETDDLTVAEAETVVVNGANNVLPALHNVVYESSDESVLRINEDGTATGMKPGTVMLKAYIQNGEKKYEANAVSVTVMEAGASESNAFLKTAEFGEELKLNAPFDGDRLSVSGTTSEQDLSLVLEAEEEEANIELFIDGSLYASRKGRLETQVEVYQGANKLYCRVTSPDKETELVYEFDITGLAEVYLSDLDYDSEKSSAGDQGYIQKDMSYDGNKISLRMEDGTKQTFEKGIGTHATCEIVYDITGLGYKTFSTYVGIDQEITKINEPDAKFYIYGDGRELASTDTMTGTTPMQLLSVSVEGVSELKLKADSLEHNWSDHVSFADAKFMADMLQKTETIHTVRYQAAQKKAASVSAESNGTQTASGFIGVKDNGTVTLIAEANDTEKYEFDGWYDADGNRCSTEASYTVSNICADAVYTARFRPSNLEELQEAIDAAVSQDALAGYTASSAAAYSEALAKAQRLVNAADATAEEIQAAIDDLQAKKDALKEKGDSSIIEAIIESEKNTVLDGYTSASVAAYQAALQALKALLENPDNVSKEEIDTATQKLAEASKALVKKGDGASLRTAVNAAKQLDLSKYTKESADGYLAALREAETVLSNPDATQSVINAALTKLQNAEKALTVLAGKEPEVPKTFAVGGFSYTVTKLDGKSNTVAVTKYTGKKAKVVIPASVKKGGYTFQVTAVNKGAFKGNKKLTTITIGANVQKIGANAFQKCTKLKSLIFKCKKLPKITGKAFKGTKVKTVTVPKAMSSSLFKQLPKKLKSAGISGKLTFKKKK